MAKKLIKAGNSLALVIDKPLLDILKINEDTAVEMTIQNGKLIVQPASATTKRNKEDIDEIVDQIIEKYGPVFEKLAKT